jgi:hypothetical protein
MVERHELSNGYKIIKLPPIEDLASDPPPSSIDRFPFLRLASLTSGEVGGQSIYEVS